MKIIPNDFAKALQLERIIYNHQRESEQLAQLYLHIAAKKEELERLKSCGEQHGQGLGYGTVVVTSAIYVHATDEGKRWTVAALDRYAENSVKNSSKTKKSRPADLL